MLWLQELRDLAPLMRSVAESKLGLADNASLLAICAEARANGIDESCGMKSEAEEGWARDNLRCIDANC
jgi:hypothetical protein